MQGSVVFLHVPKCAGTALQQGIVSVVGQDKVFLDYDNNPANPLSDHCIDPAGSARRFADGAAALDGKRVAYGHFHPEKYRTVWPNSCWMTVLRHPVDRLISHYFFWKEDRSFGPHPVRSYLLRHDLSLLDFAHLPFSRRFFRGIFFAGIERSDFAFVGRADDLDAVARAVGETLGAPVQIGSVNTGLLRLGDAARDEIEAVRPKLAALLQDEIDFYERWTSDCGQHCP